MGIEDRGYYRDEDASGGYGGGMYGPTFGGGGSIMQTMVMKIIIINVVLYVADIISGGQLFAILQLKASSIPRPWMWWELVTYGFCHASLNSESGIFHILFNMLVLFMFGQQVEARLGPWEFLRVYLLGIVLGGLAFWATSFTPLGGVACVGASAGVSTIMVLFCLYNPNAQLLLFFVIPVKAWVALILFFVVQIMSAWGNDNVSQEGHLAGGLLGVAYYYYGFNFYWMSFNGSKFKKAFKRKTPLKLHAPDDAYNDLDSEADRILEKVAEHGEASLTKKERKILEDYSRRMRQKHR